MSDNKLQDLLRYIYKATHDIVGAPLQEVILFGSYARGDFEDESDIDIALIIDKNREELRGYQDDLVHVASNLSLDGEVPISFISIPAKEFAQWKDELPFYRNVDNEGVRLSA